MTNFKTFARPHLNYGEVLYNQALNTAFHDKLESIQYNAFLAITGTNGDTSREKLYQKLGLEYLQLRHWC